MGTYSYSGKIEVVTIKTTGYYDITAYGAQGGGTKHNFGNDYEAFPGGAGAMVSGGFYLNAGDLIQIVVGGQGHPGFMAGNTQNGGAGGGGGGSFVINLTGQYGQPTPLIIAGGGGGAGTDQAGYEGVGAGHGTNGGKTPNGGAGGAYGAPGDAGPNSFSPGDHYTGGGGGYAGGRGGIGVRQPHAGYAKGKTPYGAYAGGQGGYHGYTYGWGGFGGGGGGGITDAEQNALYGGGGGGGGWGGGGGGGHKGGYGGGGGGGSFDGGIHAVTRSGVRTGDGEVVITLTTPPGTAAPGQTYTGPAGSLRPHHVNIGSHHLIVCPAEPNRFIHDNSHEQGHTGEHEHGFTGGFHALPGLIGSNTLSGYSGAGALFASHHTQAAGDWGKADESHAGHAATRWGVAPREFGLAWMDGRAGSILHR